MRRSPIIQFRTGTSEAPGSQGMIVDLQYTDFNYLTDWTEQQISGIYKLHRDNTKEEGTAAKGKLVMLEHTGSTSKAVCFQNDGQRAASAYCGNAGAGLAAYLKKSGYVPTFRMLGNASEVLIKAKVLADSLRNRYSVTQHWQLLKQYVINDAYSFLDQAAIYVSFLNEYRVLLLPSKQSFNDLCQQLSVFTGLRLTDKICLYCMETSQVRFFAASYAHGGAPITGLCTLALIREHLSYYKGQIRPHVNTPQGWRPLPELTIHADSISIRINPSTVSFN